VLDGDLARHVKVVVDPHDLRRPELETRLLERVAEVGCVVARSQLLFSLVAVHDADTGVGLHAVVRDEPGKRTFSPPKRGHDLVVLREEFLRVAVDVGSSNEGHPRPPFWAYGTRPVPYTVPRALLARRFLRHDLLGKSTGNALELSPSGRF